MKADAPTDRSDERFSIRTANERDVPLILDFIRELAGYEHLSGAVSATEERLRAALFRDRPAAEVILGELGDRPVGFAVYFQNFSTFAGRPGLYLEDLFVRPAYRRRGFGTRLLVRLAGIAVERGYGRMEWAVLDWNEMALRVYRRIGAEAMSDWTVHRLTGEALAALARRT